MTYVHHMSHMFSICYLICSPGGTSYSYIFTICYIHIKNHHSLPMIIICWIYSPCHLMLIYFEHMSLMFTICDPCLICFLDGICSQCVTHVHHMSYLVDICSSYIIYVHYISYMFTIYSHLITICLPYISYVQHM